MGKSRKLSPKEKRQQEQERRRKVWQDANASRVARNPSDKAVESVNAEQSGVRTASDSASDSGTDSGQREKNKSPAKAAGLKSIFTLPDNKLLMTTFGDTAIGDKEKSIFKNRNAALLEKWVVEQDVSSLAEVAAPPRMPTYDVEAGDHVFSLHGANGINASPADPRCTNAERMGDLIGTKSELEQQFFGRTFDDNIHIQLIYNILDIEKILAVYINSIIYELNNIFHRDTEGVEQFASDTELYDLFRSLGGKASTKGFISYEDFSTKKNDKLYVAFQRLIHLRQLAYYPDAFYDRRSETKIDPKDEKVIYHILSLLGMTRQAMAHSDAAASLYLMNRDIKGREISAEKHPVFKTLDDLYAERVKTLDTGFIDKAKKDLAILIGAMGAETMDEKTAIVNRYYDFVVRKAQKNFGFSTKKLRERIVAMTDAAGNPLVLDAEKKPLTDKKYDTVRSKMYKTMDFVIYCHYRDNEEETERRNCAEGRTDKSIRERLVESLRRCMTETEKDSVYEAEARRLWKVIRTTVLEHIVPFMKGEEIAHIEADPDVSFEMISNPISKGAKNVTRFSKLMSLLTLFLDGKEINDLLTTLQNKFENIASLRSVLIEVRKMEMEANGAAGAANGKNKAPGSGLVNAYGMFNQSERIARELNDIRSFARMRQPDPDAKRIMFVEAAELLGDSGTVEELTAYWDEKLSKEKINDAGVKRDNGFRNFIASNVIGSDRFRYLIRYSGPRQAKLLAENRALVSFVLGDIPDTQIDRYYENTWDGKGHQAQSPKAKREYLADRITGLNFKDFEKVKQGNDATAEEAADKMRKQAVIRLYLAVLYLITKNLVYINSRYFMAFQIQERDKELKFPDEKLNYLEFAEKALQSIRPTRRIRRLQARSRRYAEMHNLPPESVNIPSYAHSWIAQDLSNAHSCGNKMISLYRNQVEHLNAIRCAGRYAKDIREITSWYALYHYIMQRILEDVYKGYAEKYPAENPISDKLQGYFSAVKQYGTYCKDFVKALNIPFVYNLPRYKNLSVDGLFDRNRPGEKGCGKDKNWRKEDNDSGEPM